MFGRYAIAVGRGAHRHQLALAAAALDLAIRVETRELLLTATRETSYVASDDAILIGQAFTAAGERITGLPAGVAAARNPADLRQALAGHWGNFALFCADPDRVLVYREPSGSVPVYRCGQADHILFASDAATAMGLGLLRPDVDRLFPIHWLQYPFLRNARTGLKNVTEVLAGTAVTASRSNEWQESSLWHPNAFLGRDQTINDPEEAAQQLRASALKAVAVQCQARNIVLRLSGGLDSSIIAASIASAGTTFPCVNFATRSRDGDERQFAREVARRFGLHLVEVLEPAPGTLAEQTRISFRPTLNPLLEPFERAVEQVANGLDAALLIDGGGGDNLFCSITSAAPLIDALLSGSLPTAFRAASAIATRANATIWKVFSFASRRAWRRRRIWTEDRSLLNGDVLLPRPEPHPWLRDLDAPPGKREHVEALVHIQHFLDRAASPIEMIHPLLAQPLLELCLRIPSWLWMHGGRDRAIARDAFAGLVPRSVLQRRLKGSLQSLLYRSFDKLRFEMRDLLVEGELAREGILDRAAVNRSLASDAWKTDEVQLRVSEIVALERWLRWWRSQAGSSTQP